MYKLFSQKWIWSNNINGRKCLFITRNIYGEKLLVTNRGEIACRIIKTAKRMGIQTVAIYSASDVYSKHVKMADESIFVGPAASKDSYINIQKILEAIKTTGATMVHPGYGFLSENSAFVKELEGQNITFIGPSAESIKKMGDKLESKKLAKAAGVSTIPGYEGVLRDENHCVDIAREIGYPVMIKASAGGGGKGIRIAKDDSSAREGFRLSTQEAMSSFGDARLLLEKLVENPRHIEIQILCDKFGNMVHLFERECSIQRRNQKIIEEAPSTFLDEDTRESMANQALTLCKSLQYSSAGTVEFLVDRNKNFYFLEMNTRLQVEHPVTECITGIDLIEQMIRIGKGLPLNVSQKDIKIDGWALECRIYAEDPCKNFGLPCVGRLHKYIEPVNSAGVRCDSAIEEGSEISFYYDPLISKLICYGGNRQEAVDRCKKALDTYVIRGVINNIPLLRSILTKNNFLVGNINTNFLNQTYPSGFKIRALKKADEIKVLCIVASLYITSELRSRKFLNCPKNRTEFKEENWNLVVQHLGKETAVVVNVTQSYFEVIMESGKMLLGKNFNLAEPVTEVIFGTETVTFQLVSFDPSGEFQIIYKGMPQKLRVLSKQAAMLMKLIPKRSLLTSSKLIKSPMPGIVTSVMCKKGDLIDEGQALLIIETMKMRNIIYSTMKGKIKTVSVREDNPVMHEDILIELQ